MKYTQVRMTNANKLPLPKIISLLLQYQLFSILKIMHVVCDKGKIIASSSIRNNSRSSKLKHSCILPKIYTLKLNK